MGQRVELLPPSAASLTLLEETGDLGTYVWEPGSLRWSVGMFRVLGLEPSEDATSDQMMAVVHPDDRHLIARALDAAHADGRFEPVQYRVVRPGGEIRWILGRGRVTRDASGQVTQIIGTVADVTELHTTSQALIEANTLLAETQLAAGVGTHVFDLTTGRLELSAGLRALVGFTPDEVIDLETVSNFTHPDDHAVQQAWAARVMAGETVPPHTVRTVRRDGRIIYMETFGRRVERATGPCILGVSIDTTQRVELETELRHAAKMEAIGTLATGIAHDFNNYLTVLTMQLDALRRNARAPTAAELADMTEALDRSARLVRQLMAVARRQAFQPRPLDLCDLACGAIRLFSQASGPGIVVDLVADEPVVVDADASQLDGALMNLLVNARDAMPDGGRVTVTIDTVADGPDQWARLVVADPGIGIPADQLDHIFEPYYTTKPAGRGTGLGLPSVYGTIRQHRGTIRVESTPGHGTRFEIRLPRSTQPVLSPVTAAAPRLRPGLRVLLVEDIAAVRTAVAAMLRREGMIADQAADGLEALERVRAGVAWDVVLTDLAMPRLDGRGLRRELATLAPGLPVVVMSGHGADGQDVALAKPFTRDELVRVIADTLGPAAAPAPPR